MSSYTDSIKRNVTVTDFHPFGHITVRACADCDLHTTAYVVYVRGTRRGIYKTVNGAKASVRRHAFEK